MAKQNSKKQVTDADLDLLAKLGVDTTPAPVAKRTPREERIIAGFEEIERFVDEHGHLPQHSESRDIFERLYAVRLDRLRETAECRTLLEAFDKRDLLGAAQDAQFDTSEISDEDLLAALGAELGSEIDTVDDITNLTHVRSRKEVKAAEEVARRTRCEDFEQFKPIFEDVQRGLKSGERKTVKYQDYAVVNQGDLFILDGHKVLVAEKGEEYTNKHGHPESRLRVIFDNGTESDLLLRSLQRALNKDKAGRRIERFDLGPLFASVDTESVNAAEPLFLDEAAEDDEISGTIYVLRSSSAEPFIAENRSVIHKIGVTKGDVKTRIANAKKDPTYLLADVEIMRTVKLAQINPRKFEELLQRFFSSVRLETALTDRFGEKVQPREWFLVPLNVIEEVIDKITDGTIDQYRYDSETATLVRL